MVGGGSALRSKRDMPENVPRRSESAMSDTGDFSRDISECTGCNLFLSDRQMKIGAAPRDCDPIA